MTTNTYTIELFTTGNYAASTTGFIVDAISRQEAIIAARATGNFSHLNAAAGKKVSAKQAAKLIEEGAADLRKPKIATVENRKRLGALLGM